MPRGIPKAKSGLAIVNAAIDELLPVHNKLVDERKVMDAEIGEINARRQSVIEKINNLANALSNLGSFKRSLEPKE